LAEQLQGDDPGAALNHRDVARALRPRSPWAWFRLGWTLVLHSKLDQASAAYRRTIEIDPKFDVGHFNLGFVAQKQGRIDEAIAAYHKALELEPKIAPAHNNLGKRDRKAGQVRYWQLGRLPLRAILS
jgi:tetratricopeptide (TPR) repeat protein